ncbi:hypothetical protein TcasGA2_TC000025 [Tribolium castaneum]|uniref:Uncharacterized protein n=1 Tax=Tribolium castaneum TaxID=7070 RepID=D6WE83_TRICA|nr:hypothetical protein TcasGA2_TC000025 [Tribolium castaneum]
MRAYVRRTCRHTWSATTPQHITGLLLKYPKATHNQGVDPVIDTTVVTECDMRHTTIIYRTAGEIGLSIDTTINIVFRARKPFSSLLCYQIE